jgi:hypothetical protein
MGAQLHAHSHAYMLGVSDHNRFGLFELACKAFDLSGERGLLFSACFAFGRCCTGRFTQTRILRRGCALGHILAMLFRQERAALVERVARFDGQRRLKIGRIQRRGGIECSRQEIERT